MSQTEHDAASLREIAGILQDRARQLETIARHLENKQISGVKVSNYRTAMKGLGWVTNFCQAVEDDYLEMGGPLQKNVSDSAGHA